MTKKHQLFRIMAALDGHFGADDCLPADRDRWRQLRRQFRRQLRRHVTRIRDALALAQLTVADEPLTSVTSRELEGHVKFGLVEK
jgi:hypothetical protein